jgi:hypothetical protein
MGKLSLSVYSENHSCNFSATLFTIRLGSNNLNSNDPNGQRLATDSYVLHPDYNPDTVENDLGLIKLRMPITYTSKYPAEM